MLYLEEITVAFEGRTVLESISLSLPRTGLVVVLGPNGAGKTTLFRVVLGLQRPLKGRVVVDGVDVTGKPRLASRFMGYVPQSLGKPYWFPVTVYEALAIYAGRMGGPSPDELLRLVEFPRDHWRRPLRELSGGLWQRFLVARALAGNRRILVLDEPLASVDPGGREEIANVLAGLARERLVIVSTHEPYLLAQRADIVVLLKRRIVAAGSPDDVLKPQLLARLYGLHGTGASENAVQAP